MAVRMKKSLINLLLVISAVHGQTTTNSGDGLAPSAYSSSATASFGTVTINGTASTFRPIFTVPAAADVGANIIPNIQDPQAIDAQTVCPGYTASNVKRTAYGFSGTLSLAGKACNVYGTDIQTLTLTVQYQSADRLSVNISPAQITASNYTQYILAENLVPRPSLDANANMTTLDSDLQFDWSNDPTFSFSVTRRSTGDVLFDTSGSVLVYENQFIEFVSALPTDYNIYGLGERIHGLRLGNNFTATIYAADAGDPIDYNIYGSHPFYLDTRYYEVDSKGDMKLLTGNATANATYKSYSHGVYLRNAHGQEVLMKPENVTWRTLGGAIDLFFYEGPTQPEVTKQYLSSQDALPAMQQYFTFGFHQCRWGYANWTEVEDVVNNFAKFNIPLENIWTDIDYMDQYRDFTTDPVRYPVSQAKVFITRLHANGQHYIPIVDSAIYIPNPQNTTDAYAPYTRGNNSGVFLNNPDGSQYIGSVWPGYTVFPDWQASKAVDWWVNELVQWYKDIQFSGIWIDMSEVSSFCVGSCGSGNVTLNPVHPPFALPGEPGNLVLDYPEGFNLTNATEAAAAASASSSQVAAASSSAGPTSSTSTSYLRTTPTPGTRDVNHPPYAINNVQGDLAVHAVSPNATHVTGQQEYDVHNLFGHQILNATYQGLLAVFPSLRPFIIGRSTFVGSGRWAGHWGGDNASKWFYMAASIPQALSFSLFGIPMFGVDTCGFNSNTDEELCNRWMQLSAFFPFYRNHNVLSAIPQEPYRWASVAEATRQAISIRYALLPYMYTLFYSAHTTGSTVMRALAWEYPDDPSLANADRQFLLGPSLLVTPVLEQGATTVQGVFPGVAQGVTWYDWYSQTAVNATAGSNTTIAAPLGHIPLYVRGGSVLPMQQSAMTTIAARKTPWSLLVGLSLEGTAKGELYLDDGQSLVPNATLFVRFEARRNAVYASAVGTWNETNPLANVTVMGVQSKPGSVKLNGAAVSSSWNGTSKVLVVQELQNTTSAGAFARDWEVSWS